MKILITGGAGFVGSHLADRLIERGDTVLVVDNFATGRRDNLSPHKNLDIVETTIADEKVVQKTFAQFRPELVIHAAASYKDPNNWAEDACTNVLGTTHVVRAALENQVRRLIYFQTALCYGIKPQEQPISLEHPLRPVDSSYAISKTAGEYYIALSGLDFISFRLANAYGPRNLSGPLPTFYQRLKAQKPCFVVDTRRDFMYVSDLVALVLKAIDGQGKKGYYHVSSGKDVAILDLFNAVVESMGISLRKPVEVRPRNKDDAATILLDPRKTKKDFNWKVVAPLKKGVKAAVDYYEKFGITETYTHLTTYHDRK